MNTGYLLKQIKTTFLFLLLSSMTLGLIYPGLITLILHISCSYKANGSLVTFMNQTIGSELIGQVFNDPKYFWGRPSATSPLPYDPTISSGSNLCPTNPKLLSLINQRIYELKHNDPSNSLRIPIDLVTSSASGLDPHISILSARYQIERVARIRGIEPKKVQNLMDSLIIHRKLGFIGEPCVNVLMLNLALDREFGTQ